MLESPPPLYPLWYHAFSPLAFDNYQEACHQEISRYALIFQTVNGRSAGVVVPIFPVEQDLSCLYGICPVWQDAQLTSR
jgi:hypothetical protein